MNGEPADVTTVEDRLSRIPGEPGVYLLRDKHNKVVYVGKAKSLRSRVRMYFRGGDERMQVPYLVSRVADVYQQIESIQLRHAGGVFVFHVYTSSLGTSLGRLVSGIVDGTGGVAVQRTTTASQP